MMQLPIKVEIDSSGFPSIVDANGDIWFEGAGNHAADVAAAQQIIEAIETLREIALMDQGNSDGVNLARAWMGDK